MGKVIFKYHGEGLYISEEEHWGDSYGQYYPAADVERLVEAAIWTVKYMHHFITINESIPYDPNDEDLMGSEPFESYKKLKSALEPFKESQ